MTVSGCAEQRCLVSMVNLVEALVEKWSVHHSVAHVELEVFTEGAEYNLNEKLFH
jgi:hypothetical protein